MEHDVRTELAAVLQLAAAGRLRCSGKTKRPSAVTLRALGEVPTGGHFYEGEAVRALARAAASGRSFRELACGLMELTSRADGIWPSPPMRASGTCGGARRVAPPATRDSVMPRNASDFSAPTASCVEETAECAEPIRCRFSVRDACR